VSSKESEKASQRNLSDEVATHVSLAGIRLSKLNVELFNAAPDGPIRSVNQIENTVFSRARRLVVYELSYRTNTSDKNDIPVYQISFTLNVSFSVQLDTELSDEQLIAFGGHGVVDIAHPYARELLHSLTVRMSMPALVLEVLAMSLVKNEAKRRDR